MSALAPCTVPDLQQQQQPFEERPIGPSGRPQTKRRRSLFSETATLHLLFYVAALAKRLLRCQASSAQHSATLRGFRLLTGPISPSPPLMSTLGAPCPPTRGASVSGPYIFRGPACLVLPSLSGGVRSCARFLVSPATFQAVVDHETGSWKSPAPGFVAAFRRACLVRAWSSREI